MRENLKQARKAAHLTQQADNLEHLAKPLVKYLKENHNPHTAIVITDERVVVVEDVLGIPFPREKIQPCEIILETVQKAIDGIAEKSQGSS